MKYIDLLKNNKNIQILSMVQFIVYFGAWFSQTGVFTLLIKLNAPTWAVSISAMLAFLPGILLAPINGIIVERNSPKKILISMAGIELVSIFMLIFITSLSGLWLLFILIFIRLCVACIYFQAEMRLIAKLLNPAELKLANEIHSIIWGFSYTCGMASAGAFIYFFGSKNAFLFDCLLISLGIFILFFLKVPNFIENRKQSFLAMIKEGPVYIFKHRKILHLILLHAFIGLTSYETLITLLAAHKYKELLAASLVIGFLNATRALALVLGPLLLSSLIRQNSLAFFYYGQGFGILSWALTQNYFYLSFFGIFMAGICTSVLWAYTYTLIQEECDEKFYGRVIAYTDMIYLSFSVFVSIMVGVLFEMKLSLNLITALLGTSFILAGFYCFWFYKKYLKTKY